MVGELKLGVSIGLAVSIPVGPIALLIMRRSIRDGRAAAFVSGLGAATADLLAGSVAAFGLAAITLLIEQHSFILRLIGGLVLIAMGVHAARAAPQLDSPQPIHERSLLRAFLSTAALTLANPMSFVGLMFVCAAAGVGARHFTPVTTAFLALGIFIGSGVWWLILSLSARWLGRVLGAKTMKVLNLISAFVIIGFGVYQLGEVLLIWSDART